MARNPRTQEVSNRESPRSAITISSPKSLDLVHLAGASAGLAMSPAGAAPSLGASAGFAMSPAGAAAGVSAGFSSAQPMKTTGVISARARVRREASWRAIFMFLNDASETGSNTRARASRSAGSPAMAPRDRGSTENESYRHAHQFATHGNPMNATNRKVVIRGSQLPPAGRDSCSARGRNRGLSTHHESIAARMHERVVRLT